MIFKDRIIDIISFLENGKTVLLPCEHRWKIAITIHNVDKYMHLSNVGLFEKNCTILFEDLDSLKQNLPRLHPRVETMLVYYKRPFLMKVRSNELSKIKIINGSCYVSLARNEYLKTILSLMGQPLLLFSPNVKINDDFQMDNTSQNVLSEVDFICKETGYLSSAEDYAIFAYDDEGMLME